MSIEANNNLRLPIAANIHEDNQAGPPSYEEAMGQLTETNHPIEIELSFPDSIGFIKKFLYEGTLLNGKPHDKGIAKGMLLPEQILFTDIKFEGTFLQGNLAEGTMTGNCFAKSYVGTFKDNSFLKGKLIRSDNVIVDGEFGPSCSLRKGIITYPNGEKHEGTFNEWELLVIGTTTSSDNQITTFNLNALYPSIDQGYRYYSEGQITLPNGEIHQGIFHDMILSSGTISLPDGRIDRVIPPPAGCTIL